MQLKTNYKDIQDSEGKVKFSILKKKGKHQRGKVNSHSKPVRSRNK